MLRYRLYEIDRLISRTLSYTVLTGLLIGVFAGLVLLTTRVLPFSSPVGVATSTLAAAALFNPLRRRIQQLVDRRFNRARYDAQATVATCVGCARPSTPTRSATSSCTPLIVRSRRISLWTNLQLDGVQRTFDARPTSVRMRELLSVAWAPVEKRPAPRVRPQGTVRPDRQRLRGDPAGGASDRPDHLGGARRCAIGREHRRRYGQLRAARPRRDRRRAVGGHAGSASARRGAGRRRRRREHLPLADASNRRGDGGAHRSALG